MGKCLACNAAAALKCSACNSVYFCDTICQRKAWPTHKLECRNNGSTATAAPSTADKPAVQTASAAPRSKAERSLDELTAFVRSAAHAHVHLPPSMTISSMLVSEAFCRHAYPGINIKDLPEGSPLSLMELLESIKLRAACIRTAERACDKAEEILRNVKAKGQAAGELMDEKTEKGLWPQVFSEAFVRQVPLIFAELSAECQARTTEDASLLASPFHVLATSNYLTGPSLEGLTSDSTRFCVQQGPFAAADARDWCDLLTEDLAALLAQEDRWSEPIPVLQHLKRTTPSGANVSLKLSCSSSFLWADPGEMETEYPAIAELMQRLHALPFELNRKLPAARLVRPQPGMVVIQRFSCSIMAAPPCADASEGCQTHILPFGNQPRLLFGMDRKGK
jgi:hypothetical protein